MMSDDLYLVGMVRNSENGYVVFVGAHFRCKIVGADFAPTKNFVGAKPYPNSHPNTHTNFLCTYKVDILKMTLILTLILFAPTKMTP